MIDLKFKVLLNNKVIGSTALEKADVPMGVLFGQLQLDNIDDAYDFFKAYCLHEHIGFTDDKEGRFITTRHISNLEVVDTDNAKIKGAAISVSGQGESDFEITIEGVPHSVLGFKFKHHVEYYRNQLEQYFDKDNISEIGIYNSGRLFIKPENATFPLIYRTATEVHWDDKHKFLYSPKPNEWTYLDWYRQIISVIKTECHYELKLTDKTQWSNIPDNLKKQIIEA